jgi:signal-transduction protein with cAMP-binding, CBS, and nucleotidyltransferase domain
MAIKLEIFEENSKITCYGDPGEKFYMLLKGNVSIYVPNLAKVSEKEYNERKLK